MSFTLIPSFDPRLRLGSKNYRTRVKLQITIVILFYVLRFFSVLVYAWRGQDGATGERVDPTRAIPTEHPVVSLLAP